MSEENKPKIVKPKLSIKEKIGMLKFNPSAQTISKAERKLHDSEDMVLRAVKEDLAYLSNLAKSGHELTPEEMARVSELAFSIRSRSGNAGYDLVTEIADSLYEYAASRTSISPETVVQTHVSAIEAVIRDQIKDSKSETGQRLMAGLKAVIGKFSRQDNP